MNFAILAAVVAGYLVLMVLMGLLVWWLLEAGHESGRTRQP